jgi:hypothetical protein
MYIDRPARSNNPERVENGFFARGRSDLGCRSVDVLLRWVIPAGGTDSLIVIDHKDCWRFGV